MGTLATVLIRTAWIGDDAFISFGTAANFVNGDGLRFNIDERVQAFTHPLWLLVFSAAYAITREPYYTALVLGMLCTLAATLLIVRRLADPWPALLATALLASSKAFVDFGTSGLENSLTYLLLAIFLVEWWTAPSGSARAGRLSFYAALCALNRLDLVLLVGPALLAACYSVGVRRALRPLLIGMLPLAAWEVFSLVYYGFALPNTAYAKVFGAALPLSAAIRQGAWYFAETFSFDRVTLPAIALAAAIGLVRRGSDRPVAAGLVLYSAYVMGIGGDFMFGRFVAAPFLCGVALLVRRASVLPSPVLALSAVAVLAAGLSSPYTPVLLSGGRFAFGEVCNECNALSHHGVCDERRCYYPATGLLPQLYAQHGAAWEPHGWIANELVPLQSEVHSGHRVALVHMAGVSRYITPADVHIVDRYGLADALLARLPAKPDSRVGHYERSIPDGYFKTIESGVSRIANPNVSCYYQHLRLVIAGPIWNAERFATIAEFLVGRYDGLLRPGAPVTRCDESP